MGSAPHRHNPDAVHCGLIALSSDHTESETRKAELLYVGEPTHLTITSGHKAQTTREELIFSCEFLNVSQKR
jgi:hypothetical protein